MADFQDEKLWRQKRAQGHLAFAEETNVELEKGAGPLRLV